MLLRLIACNVFLREACWCIARSPHVVDPEFTELGQHVNSNTLRELIQSKIDAADRCGKKYDAVLLLFGLCGNATAGLRAGHFPLVIPRAHDCCTILLGSKAAFQEHFARQPSTPFSSVGYMERGEYFLRTGDGEPRIEYGEAYEAYVRQYGRENAQYIWESLHPERASGNSQPAVFIDLPETAHLGHAERFRQKAQEAGRAHVCLQGSIRLIRNLIFGRWDAEDFLVLQPGQRTVGVYDFAEVLRAE